eukprot:ANDGO_01503.mRNA.1 hypothetical protein
MSYPIERDAEPPLDENSVSSPDAQFKATLRPSLRREGPTAPKMGEHPFSSSAGTAIWPPDHAQYAPMSREVMDADRERFHHEQLQTRHPMSKESPDTTNVSNPDQSSR